MGFQKGESGNPNGRPKGSRNYFSIAELKRAIKDVEELYHEDFLQHAVKRAYESDRVLVALLKKLIPDAQPTGIDDGIDWSKIRLEILPGELSEKQIEEYKRFIY